MTSFRLEVVVIKSHLTKFEHFSRVDIQGPKGQWNKNRIKKRNDGLYLVSTTEILFNQENLVDFSSSQRVLCIKWMTPFWQVVILNSNVI